MPVSTECCQYFTEHIANHGRLPEPFARRIYWQVVSAVDYCHKRGVVHRDLKVSPLNDFWLVIINVFVVYTFHIITANVM